MVSDDNSVNIKQAKRGYHHGDLRAALVAAGQSVLNERGADEVSLREIARAVGVSATAVYRHFPDKEALLRELCTAGGRALAQQQMAAMQAAGGGRAGLEAVGKTYVRFAIANPTLFRMMMKRQSATDFFAATGYGDESGLDILRQNIADLSPAGTSEAQLGVSALRAWSIVHGLAMLMLDGQIPHDDTVIDAVIDSVPIGLSE